MSRRRDQRRAAVVALYQHELTGRPLAQVFPRDASDFTRALAYATDDRRAELDALISRHARGWTLQRIAPLERNILRVGLLELLDPDVVAGDTPIPAEGAVEEAVEMAKTWCGLEAPGFVNGILGAALRERRTPA